MKLVLTSGAARMRSVAMRRPATWARCTFCEGEYRTTPSDLRASKRPMCSQACAELDAMLRGFVGMGVGGDG